MALPRTTSDDVRFVVRKACSDVLRHYGFTGAPAEGRAALGEGTGRFEGIVALEGPDLRALCIVTAKEEILSHASPIQLPFDALRDWVGEVANQLAGRVKVLLRARGLRLALSAPRVRIRSLGTSRPPGVAVPYELSFGNGDLVVSFDFELLNGERAPSPSGQPAGASAAFDEFLFIDVERLDSSAPKRRG